MKGRIYQKIKNGNWYVDYFFNGRRVRQMIGPSKKLAQAVLSKRLTEVAENKHLDVKKEQKIKFKDFAHTYLETHAKPNKRSWRTSDEKYLRNLIPVFGENFLYEITPEAVERYKAQRKEKVSVASVNRDLALLKCMFNKAIAWGYASDNPVRKVKLYKENNWRIRYLEKEEIEKLLAASPFTLRAILIVALNTGMRKSEIQNLKWNDVNYERGYITLYQTKNGEKRFVPINKSVREALLSIRKNPEGAYIFCGKDGQPFNFRKSFETALKKSGINGFRFHDCRHTFASHLVMAGVDLNTVRDLLGHKTLGMTLRYSHLSPDHRARAVEVLGNKIGTVLAPNPTQRETAKVDEVVSELFTVA